MPLSSICVKGVYHGTSRASALMFAGVVFLAAFLLFQAELIAGKFLLPWFGGAAAVWTTCMLLFQLLLLAGYGYAHWTSTRLSPRVQVTTHITFVVLSVAALTMAAVQWPSPITPNAEWRPIGADFPEWSVIRVLTVSIGLPFLLLGTTAPLLQVWFARARTAASAYRLYSLSNAGALLGLVTYPLIVEPKLGLRLQGWLWSVLFLIFALGCIACSLLGMGKDKPVTPATIADPPEGDAPAVPSRSPRASTKFFWLGLAACASMMMLATTNLICQDVAVIPLLWVLPLSLYLISFIICFDKPRWYQRAAFQPLYAIALLVAAATLIRGNGASWLVQVGSYSSALFALCMVCHGELARLKPPAGFLTEFYLLVAVGGALGGVIVGVIAPRLFSGWWEFHIALVASAILLGVVLGQDPASWLREGGKYWLPWLLLLGFAFLPVDAQWRQILWRTLSGKVFSAAALVLAIPVIVGLGRRKMIYVPSSRICMGAVWFGLLTLLLGSTLALNIWGEKVNRVSGERNFYGILTVKHDRRGLALGLRHGATFHGFQLINEPREPTSYYGRDSGIGLLLTHHPRRGTSAPHLRVGVIGLGVGTLAAYGKPGDYFRFYEINPLVAEFCRGPHPYFTFLNDSLAKIDLVMGDARLSLEREAEAGELQRFDVLVVDAFNSDAIPVHLLTREAMQLYLKHLTGPEGVVAFHISNKSLNLVPVLLGLCEELNLKGLPVLNHGQYQSDWVLLSQDEEALDIPELLRAATPSMFDVSPLVWTDDFSSLYQVLKRGEEFERQ